eukprot:gb/GFBE01012677.1/.p1 GENE.gb/GFBE01012677.1/~~gb/GFBE01012677.1/.p1  ORF type:complete len:191 (+),score=37.56 gb/GFBE01012677.1/:1-573(+)
MTLTCMVRIAASCLAIFASSASSDDGSCLVQLDASSRREREADSVANLQAERWAHHGPPIVDHFQEAVSVSEDACTVVDNATLWAAEPMKPDGLNAQVTGSCGMSSVGFFSFDKDHFARCFAASLKVSMPCANCYGGAAAYTFYKCMFPCASGRWCSRECLDCVAPYQSTAQNCVGSVVQLPTASELYCD